jgi:hypothetical protein
MAGFSLQAFPICVTCTNWTVPMCASLKPEDCELS